MAKKDTNNEKRISPYTDEELEYFRGIILKNEKLQKKNLKLFRKR